MLEKLLNEAKYRAACIEAICDMQIQKILEST